MLRFKRPPKPRGFDEKMKPHRKAVADLVATGEPPSFNEDVWRRDYKIHFSEAQYGKCCYCEAYVHATDHGDVEHFRPKSSVSTLLAAGSEIKGTPNIRGRSVKPVTTGPLRQGYWWLAYTWTNWLFACTLCNSTWKKTLFPLAGAPKPRSPRPGVKDRPLLLHPYGRAQPCHHLSFDRLGQVQGTSPKGRETVRTLGLDRETLRQKRGKIAARMYELLDQALDRLVAGEEPDPSAMQEVLRQGEADMDYAGMVRIVFEQAMPWTWAQLEQRYGPAG